MNISIATLGRAPWQIALLIWAGLLLVSSFVGGASFFFATPLQTPGLFCASLAAWLYLWVDEGASRRMRSVIGAGAFFYGWILFFAAERSIVILTPWVDSTLIMIFGAAYALESPWKIADDLVG